MYAIKNKDGEYLDITGASYVPDGNGGWKVQRSVFFTGRILSLYTLRLNQDLAQKVADVFAAEVVKLPPLTTDEERVLEEFLQKHLTQKRH